MFVHMYGLNITSIGQSEGEEKLCVSTLVIIVGIKAVALAVILIREYHAYL